MNNCSRKYSKLWAVALIVCMAGCAKKVDDPLKYTKKLAKEGHLSLYNNGAFRVPHTSITLIPPGPDTLQFAGELAGLRAKQSMTLSLKRAAESVDVVVEGTKESYELAKKIHQVTDRGAKAIRREVSGTGIILVSKSYSAGKNIAVKSWEFSKERVADINRLTSATIESFDKSGKKVSGAMGKAGESLSEKSERLGESMATGAAQKGEQIAGASVIEGEEIAESGEIKSKEIARGAIRKGDDIVEGSIARGKEIMMAPAKAGKEIIRKSSEVGDEISAEATRKGEEMARRSVEKGEEIGEKYREAGERHIDKSLEKARGIYRRSRERSGKALYYGYEQFVVGYATLPSKLGKRKESIGDSLEELKLGDIAREEWERARKLSKGPAGLAVETVSDYAEDVSEPFRRAKEELSEGYKTSSMSFSILKSIGWVLKGLLWDATLEPAAKITAASVGYIGVNMVAFPAMVVMREGITTVEVAAEVTWNTARGAYDIVAPTPIAAVAGVYSLVDYASSNVVAGVTALGGTMAGMTEKGGGEVARQTVKGAGQVAGAVTKAGGKVAGEVVKGAGAVTGAVVAGGGTVPAAAAGTTVMGAGQVAGVATKGGGQVAAVATRGGAEAAAVLVKGAGKMTDLVITGAGQVAGALTKGTGKVAGATVKGAGKVTGLTIKGTGYAGAGLQYIGVPLAAAGITVTGGALGTTVGTAGGLAGGSVSIVGESGAAATQLFGNTIAGTALAGGTAISTAGGGALGVYELSKAVVVPAGYELGSGIVLSYGTLSHMGAHSILAVSDFSYMVLSLEGPRWVVYAVKGNLGQGEELMAGTVLDLNKMQEGGEEMAYLPLSDEEMKNVVESVYENLPVFEEGPQ
ncbi:MAG: hypothetical protein OEV42_03520 [Deltaproteobacteria bacterium]|nr:hypothetical protein [Deltaproteobacteria bacterium]